MPNDRYAQKDLNLPQKEGANERQKRKRDFSKVIDIAHKALHASQIQTIEYSANPGLGYSS